MDLLCEECVMICGCLFGGGGFFVVGKWEIWFYEFEERLYSSSRGVKIGVFCSVSRNVSEWILFFSEWSVYVFLEIGVSKRVCFFILRFLDL